MGGRNGMHKRSKFRYGSKKGKAAVKSARKAGMTTKQLKSKSGTGAYGGRTKSPIKIITRSLGKKTKKAKKKIRA